MLLLFSLGQHRAMVAVQAQLKEGERLFAFLDDIYVVCSPQGKTKLWNAAGCKAAMADMLTVAAKRRSPEAVVWKAQLRMKTAEQLR